MKASVLLACFLLAASVCALEAQDPDLILVNGKIFTADPAQAFAEALAISGDRIAAVGSSAEIKKLAGDKTKIIDLRGRVVIPGINDAHYHFSPDPKGFILQFQSMEPTWSETVTAIQSAAKKVPAGSWIFGYVGYQVALNPEVTRFAIDNISPDHPLLLQTYYGHGYILNSKAMAPLQVAEEEPDPIGGYYERVAGSHKINGRYWEYAEWNSNRRLTTQISDEEMLTHLKTIADEAVRYGITSMQMMAWMPIDRFANLLQKADLPIRVRAIAFPLSTAKGRELWEIQQLSTLSLANSKVQVSGIKWILDGTPFEHGAALRKGYADRPDWKGKMNFPATEVDQMLQESLNARTPLLLHAGGDRTIEIVFNAMENHPGNIDWVTKRVRLEHGDGVIQDLIPRAKKLGVVVVQNPSHFLFPELFQQRWGNEYFRFRTLLSAGVALALGSDGPLNPFLNVMFATTHPCQPEEAITREQAIHAYTYGSAFAEFAEKEKGTISKGKFADLAVLSQDIFNIPVEELPKTTSIFTVIGGEVVYDANILR